MKTVRVLAAQGDVAFQRIDQLPEGLTEQPAALEYVVAHSENGAHHVARPSKVHTLDRYTDPSNPLVSYLRISKKRDALVGKAEEAKQAIDAVLIEHQREHHTHETLALACEGEEAVYRVVRQRELRPEGWVAVQD